jgi:hypothetical protein
MKKTEIVKPFLRIFSVYIHIQKKWQEPLKHRALKTFITEIVAQLITRRNSYASARDINFWVSLNHNLSEEWKMDDTIIKKLYEKQGILQLGDQRPRRNSFSLDVGA